MDVHGNLVKMLRLKIALLVTLRHSVRFLTVWGFLLGVTILVLRVILTIPRPLFLWTLLSFLPSVMWAIFLAVREMPSKEVLCALLDEQNQCGGLLMATEEVNLGSWHKQLPPVSKPALKWHGGRSLSLLAAAAIFVAISFLVPQRYVNISSARPLNISEDVEQLKQQINTLEEGNIISEETAQEFDQKLERLQDTASGYDPVKTWEALDHLQQSLKKHANQFTASALSQTESLANAETLAQGLSEDGVELDVNLFSEAMLELSAMIQSCLAENKSLKKALGSDCLKACGQGTLNPQQLKELLQALKENKVNFSRCLGRLCDAGLIDLKTLKLCEKLGTCNSKGLIAFLNENADRMGMCDAVSLYCQYPGRGGVSRGRCDAPMTWTDGSTEEGATFKEQVLPPASLAALKESLMLGVSVDAPSVEKSSTSSSTGVLDSAKSSDASLLKKGRCPTTIICSWLKASSSFKVVTSSLGLRPSRAIVASFMSITSAKSSAVSTARLFPLCHK